MTVTLKIHLEAAGDPQDGFVWWAESDDLPGFNAAADHLPDLIAQATDAIREIRGDQVEIVQELVLVDDEEQRPGPVVANSEPETPVRQVIVSSPVPQPA